MCIRIPLFLGALVAAAPAGAQSPASSREQVILESQKTGVTIAEQLRLEDALALLRERSPLLFAEREQIDVARGGLDQAGKGPNPSFSVETEEFAAVDGANESRTPFLSAA